MAKDIREMPAFSQIQPGSERMKFVFCQSREKNLRKYLAI